MKGKLFITCVLAACLLALVFTETARANTFPPIAAPLVRQGTLAVSLAASLGLPAGSEAAAINNLSQIGIIPRGGWSAASLVTPALIGELHNSIFLAARSGQLLISANKVVTRFNSVRLGLGLPIFPVRASARSAFLNAGVINPSLINKFFINNGLPLMTFFPPPNQFRNLFTFTPFPFVSSNVFFPGFFMRKNISNGLFIRASNFGRTTPALIQLDNALGFRSVRFSTDALLTAQLRSPFFVTAFRTPTGFAFRTFSRDRLFLEQLSSPFFVTAFRTPTGFAFRTFSREGLFLERLSSPFFSTAFRTPTGFAVRTFSRDGLFLDRLSSPLFISSNVVSPRFLLRQNISNRFFIRASNFGRTTPQLIAIDNALGFNSVRFSTDALLTSQLRSPFFSNAFVTPVGFRSQLFSKSVLTGGTLSPVKSAAFVRPTAFPSRFVGSPRPFARAGHAGGRSALRRR